MKKTIYLNGIVVGEYEATGDNERDLAAVSRFLDERGLRKEFSLFDRVFNQAVAFATTAAYIHKTDLARPPPRNGRTFAPFVVNLAFACELYLKALAARHGKVLHGHELLKLHKALPSKAQSEIVGVSARCALDRNLPTGTDFVACLRQLNNSFLQWRYIYERAQAGPIAIEPAIFVVQALHEACRSKPDA